MAELILTLRDRELSRTPITARVTTIGRDPASDIFIDNAGISRTHAQVQAVEDIFVVRDCDSQNGLTLNGEPCTEARLTHGDVLGINKFLLRFSNESLAVPDNLRSCSEKPDRALPKEVQPTLALDEGSAQAFAAIAKEQIARHRQALQARGGESLGPPPTPRPVNSPSLSWEEPERTGPSHLALFLGGALVGGALIAGVLSQWL